MRALAKVGFTQSYTYFTWRNTREELTAYLEELTGTEMAEYFRGNFFVNTPDILPEVLQRGGPAAFRMRAALAATLSPLWGIYSGFELGEGDPVPGTEEYLDSEKYEVKVRDWDRPGHLKEYIARLNRIRREHPCLQHLRPLRFCPTDSPHVLAYLRATPEGDDALVTAVNLDPWTPRDARIALPLEALGFGAGRELRPRRAALGIARPRPRSGPRRAPRSRPEPGGDLAGGALAAPRAALRVLRVMTDPLWYKDAIFYELHVRAFRDGNGDGIGDFAGLTEKLEYLKDLGRGLPVAPALLPVAPQGRRLRRRGLPRHPPRVRDHGRLRALSRDGPRPRDARHLRPGREPHLRPARLVPGRAPRPRLALPRLLRLERHRPALPRRPHHLSRFRAVQLVLGPGGQGLLLAPLLPPPARPQLRQPGGAARDAGHPPLLARQGARRLPLRRRALPLRARGHHRREPARDPRLPQGHARGRRRALPGPHPPRRGQPVAGRRARLLRRRRRVPHGLPLPADAAHLPGRAPRRPAAHHRHLPAHPADPGQLPVVPVPAQPRRADARDGHRGGAPPPVLRVRVTTRACGSTSASAAGSARSSTTTGGRSSCW